MGYSGYPNFRRKNETFKDNSRVALNRTGRVLCEFFDVEDINPSVYAKIITVFDACPVILL